MSVFARGLAIGFAIAAPVGPIGVLCIRRSIADGRVAGFVTGLGAATADAWYGAVAAFGLTAVSGALSRHAMTMRVGGGVFLLLLGARAFFSRPSEAGVTMPRRTLRGAYTTTVLLTLANPTTLLSFAAVYASFGLLRAHSTARASVLVAGVFCGSALWWFLLSGGASMLRARIDARGLRALNRVSGAVIAGFGVAALAGAAAR